MLSVQTTTQQSLEGATYKYLSLRQNQRQEKLQEKSYARGQSGEWCILLSNKYDT